MVQAGWDDVPHLDEKTKTQLLSGIMPHLRDARSKGIPSMGAGAIYPIPLEEVLVKPFDIPAFWPRFFALDVGWKKTAALWFALDRENDTLYAYAEHYAGQQVPAIHAAAMKARGAWMRGVIDPASRGRSQIDGEKLFEQYTALGLKLTKADNSVESGLYEVWSRLQTNRLKFFTTLSNLQAEYRLYRRDENGKIVKEFDHLMDALRYGAVSGIPVASVRPVGSGGSRANYQPSDQTAGY